MTNGKNSKPRPYSPAKHDEGYDKIDWGKIDEGVFVETIWDGEKPHNEYTFEGERIRCIMPSHGGKYTVFFDKKPWIIMDKWAICQEVQG